MGLIRCLTIFSTVMSTFLIIFATQLASSKNHVIYLVLVIALSIACSFSICLLLCKLVQAHLMKDDGKGDGEDEWKKEGKKKSGGAISVVEEEDESFLKTLAGLPTKLRLQELEAATRGFSKMLGKGGFGTVYEGEMGDGKKVAVKRLEAGCQQMRYKEFCAEVGMISGIHHVNLVKLMGFCAEGRERLLVYEYMENGSLDGWLFNCNGNGKEEEAEHEEDDGNKMRRSLSWDVRFRVALETARALAYLHEECRETILHLDVKPQNILLDDKLHAKVSDFGLSRAMDRDQSRLLTSMRGTPGYLAPEWLINTGITSKSDVYSYGMVLLELVSGRRNVDHRQNSENWYFPTLAFRMAQECRMAEIIDPSLRSASHESVDLFLHQAQLAIRVAFWCIQDSVAARPPMSSVVKMLEGNMPVSEPPPSGVFSFTNILVLGSASPTAATDRDHSDPLQQHHLQIQIEEPSSISVSSNPPSLS